MSFVTRRALSTLIPPKVNRVAVIPIAKEHANPAVHRLLRPRYVRNTRLPYDFLDICSEWGAKTGEPEGSAEALDTGRACPTACDGLIPTRIRGLAWENGDDMSNPHVGHRDRDFEADADHFYTGDWCQPQRHRDEARRQLLREAAPGTRPRGQGHWYPRSLPGQALRQELIGQA